MRIAIFTNNYLPNPYGVSTSIETFRHDFEKLGHEVFIFAPKWRGYEDKNKNVFRYPSVDIEIKFRFPLAIPYSWKMDKILESLDLDIIHAQHPNLLGTAAKKWARKKKIPLVFTWHTLYDQYTNFVPFIPPKISSEYMIKKAVEFANDSNVVIVPTDSITRILRNWGVKKEIIQIATGVVESDFMDSNRKVVRDKLKIKDNEVVLLLVSRLTEEKNVEFVLRSVKDILRNSRADSPHAERGNESGLSAQGVKLLILGDGYLMPKIKEFVTQEKLEDKIILTGIIERNEIKNYFATGDIFVYGSKSETQGMILTEAMYSGLPIVAVNATGTKSLVLNNGNGYLVKEDKEEFAGAVEKLILDKSLRQRFGEASKKIARENFTSEVCARKMLRMYEKTIGCYSK